MNNKSYSTSEISKCVLTGMVYVKMVTVTRFTGQCKNPKINEMHAADISTKRTTHLAYTPDLYR